MLKTLIAMVVSTAIVGSNPHSMQFKAQHYTADRTTFDIEAVGTITDATPRAFEKFVADNGITAAVVHFDSGGGALLAGMELGRAIRSHRFSTVLDLRETALKEAEAGVTRVRSTRCESACVLAFLGGLTRRLSSNPGENGTYHGILRPNRHQNQLALHQFNTNVQMNADRRYRSLIRNTAQSIAQALAADIAAYLRDMDIDAKVMEFANRSISLLGDGRELYEPTLEELQTARVLSAGDYTPFRLYPYRNKALVLASQFSNDLSLSKDIHFVCNLSQRTGRHLFLVSTLGFATSPKDGPAPVEAGEAESIVPVSDPRFDNMDWSLELAIDDKVIAAGNEASALESAESSATLGVRFNSALPLEDNVLAAIRQGRTLRILHWSKFGITRVAYYIDNGLKDGLDLVSRNCVQIDAIAQ